MKLDRITRLVFGAALTAATTFVGGAASAIPVLSLDVDTPTPADVGSTIDLTLSVDGVGEVDNATFLLTYDTDLVSYAGGVFNSGFFLSEDQLGDAIDNEPGASGDLTLEPLTAGVFTFVDPPLSGDFDIVTLSFTALAPGTADFAIDPFSEAVLTRDVGTAGSPDIQVVLSDSVSASVPIIAANDGGDTAAIPLPASALLLLAGAGGLAGLRRARRG